MESPCLLCKQNMTSLSLLAGRTVNECYVDPDNINKTLYLDSVLVRNDLRYLGIAKYLIYI